MAKQRHHLSRVTRAQPTHDPRPGELRHLRAQPQAETGLADHRFPSEQTDQRSFPIPDPCEQPVAFTGASPEPHRGMRRRHRVGRQQLGRAPLQKLGFGSAPRGGHGSDHNDESNSSRAAWVSSRRVHNQVTMLPAPNNTAATLDTTAHRSASLHHDATTAITASSTAPVPATALTRETPDRYRSGLIMGPLSQTRPRTPARSHRRSSHTRRTVSSIRSRWTSTPSSRQTRATATGRRSRRTCLSPWDVVAVDLRRRRGHRQGQHRAVPLLAWLEAPPAHPLSVTFRVSIAERATFGSGRRRCNALLSRRECRSRLVVHKRLAGSGLARNRGVRVNANGLSGRNEVGYVDVPPMIFSAAS